jgi:hypothetical protein
MIGANGMSIGSIIRVAIALVAGALLTISPAQAKHGHHRHVHARRVLPVATAQFAAQAPIHLGPMRYYGGPKSPMWRAPVEN